MTGRRFRCVAPLLFTAFFASPKVLADVTKEQCIDANGQGQELRREGKLSAAREQLRRCASSSCPAMVQDDCTKRLDDLERAQPAIVFDAKDGAGHDVSIVKVTMDGRPLVDKLDGTPLDVDPGEHLFAFILPDRPPVTQTFVLKEGDKERRERVVLGAAIPPGTSETAPPSQQSAPSLTPRPGGDSGAGMGMQKKLGLGAGGIGVAGIAVGSVFGLMTLSEASQQEADCASATNCAHPSQAASEHSKATTDRTLSMVGFIAGGALLVGGAVLFFTARPSSRPHAATALVVPRVGPTGGGISLSGWF
jgi:hypothetical protein